MQNKFYLFYICFVVVILSFNYSFANNLSEYEVQNKKFSTKNTINVQNKTSIKKFTSPKNLSMRKINKYQFRKTNSIKPKIIKVRAGQK